MRTPDYTAENMRGIYAGTDQVVKISYAPRTAEPVSPAATFVRGPVARRRAAWSRYRRLLGAMAVQAPGSPAAPI